MTAVWQADRAQQHDGPNIADFFSYGFRPFFLGAAVYATLLMTVWLAFIVATHTGGDGAWLPISGSPYAWHAHEFAIGFGAAALAGFLLTAVPNWTGALPLNGAPLAALFSLWLAGRAAMLLSGVLPPVLTAVADLAFVPALAGVALRQLLVKPAARNVVLISVLLLITAANAVFHLSTYGVLDTDPLAAMRMTVLALVVMSCIIGGRIIPAFTHNWLNVRRYTGPMPYRSARLDAAAMISIAGFAVSELWNRGQWICAAIATTAAVVHGVRLYGWRGWETRSEPILWILHAGYAWIVIGLVLSALARLTDVIPASLAYHAFGAGAAATLILAVMSRASLGHTGRRLIAPRLVVWSYWAITIAAVLRVFAPLLITSPARTGVALTLAALAWIAAFGLFTAVYAPILTTPRVREKRS